MKQSELHALGCRLRTLGSTRGDLVTYIDGTLPLLVHVSAPKPEILKDTVECPACAERRRKKAAAQKRWRKGQQSTGQDRRKAEELLRKKAIAK